MRNKIFLLRSRREGFTLIELLVVIAIIGLLATIAVVALNSARTSSRDAKRIADIRQVQTGLEMYFNQETAYPECDADTVLTGIDDCVATGITTFISGINNIKDPVTANVDDVCDNGELNCDYTYVDNELDNSTYTIRFFLEGTSGSLGDGPHTATPAGIQ